MRLQTKLVDIRHEFELELGGLAHRIHGGLAGHQCGAVLLVLLVGQSRHTVHGGTVQSRVGAEHAERHPTFVDGRIRERTFEAIDVVAPGTEAGGGQRQAGT